MTTPGENVTGSGRTKWDGARTLVLLMQKAQGTAPAALQYLHS